MIEEPDHWRALGYDLIEGQLTAGSTVRIRRSKENSPSTISEAYAPDDILSANVCDTFLAEAENVASSIQHAIVQDGLMPEDILVIAADDHSPAQFRPPCHPVAHLHMGFSSEVRIATRRHWTPESFTMFIVRQYFPQAWHNLLERNKETHFPGAVRHNLDEVVSMHWPIIQEAEVYLW